MKAMKTIVNKVIAPAAKKRGMLTGKILIDWDKIVGLEYAGWCQPEKIMFSKTRRNGGTLYLTVNPSHALLITHSQDILLQKINTYFGYNAVSNLKLRQTPLSQIVTTVQNNTSQPSNTLPKLLESSAENRLEVALKNLETLIEHDQKKKP